MVLHFIELIESTLYMYRATKNPALLDFGKSMLDAIESVAKMKCGYATVCLVIC